MLETIDKRLPEVLSREEFESDKIKNIYTEIVDELASKKEAYALNDDLDEIYEYIEKQRNRLEQEYALHYPEKIRDSGKITEIIKELCRWLAFYVIFTGYCCEKYIDYSCDANSQEVPVYQTSGRLSKIPGISMINSMRLAKRKVLFIAGTPMEIVNGIVKTITEIAKKIDCGRASKKKIMELYDRVAFKISIKEETKNEVDFESAALNYDEYLESERATYIITDLYGKKKAIPHAALREYMEKERDVIDNELRKLYDMLEVQKSGYEFYKIAMECGSDNFEIIYWANIGKCFMSFSLIRDDEGLYELLGNIIQYLHMLGFDYRDIREKIERLAEDYKNC